ncbi:MAG: DUF542 domain-containing protein [Elusimicrobia bacterium]|nr:DUF542 domain-containing protein [Elusimicrobiota bacterium]MDE2424841.1 DUF542 domain-containing protein [Elusimicrobiota bacterium]
MKTETVLDVRTLPPPKRHPKIFAAWEGLAVGGKLKLVNDHDPKPLFYVFQAERAGEFEWTPLQEGPEIWTVAITRVASRKPASLITLNLTVNEVATRYPRTQEVLVRHGLDMCCGGIHPLELAAKAHGIDAAALLRELNAVAAAGQEPERPSWAREPADREIDVREELRDGGEPFNRIMAAAAPLKRGETLLVRSIFAAAPLAKTLEGKGFEHWAHRVDASDWKLFFRKQGRR